MNMKVNILKSKIQGPSIIIVGCLHGNEIVGNKVINELKKLKLIKGTVKTIVANEEAMLLNKRFIHQDLNRSFPGNLKSKIKEEKIAYKILKEIKRTDYVIDIHSTTSDTEDVIIIKKETSLTKKMTSIIKPKRIVIMSKNYGNGALINFCHGISIEYGKHKSKDTFTKSLNDIKYLLFSLGMIKEEITKPPVESQYYYVFDVALKLKGFKLDASIKNFLEVKKGQVIGKATCNPAVKATESFYPVLFGEKSYKDIIGFKAKKLLT